MEFEAVYVPVWCKSNYSFLEGASHPGELVEEAHHLGLRAVALTDRDGLYGIVRAHVRARELGVRLLVGSEISLNDGSTLVLLARDRAGYGRLCRLISLGRLRSPKGICHVAWQEVWDHAEGLLALWGGDRSLLTAPNLPDEVVGSLRDAFGDRLFAMVARHRRPDEPSQEARLKDRARRWRIPSVAAVEVLYHCVTRRPLQDVLTCVRHGTSLTSARRLIKPNAEHGLKSSYAFDKLFSDDPASVERTLDVAERCAFRMDDLRYVYPVERLPDGSSSDVWLRHLSFEGAKTRYGGVVPEDVARQLDKELSVITELDYCGYFLTMWEIVQFCARESILCQGRGSAANSAVCYCLGITAIDPVRMGLLFERFLSKERAEPPDVDLDVQHGRREEVIQWIYEKYGRERAAMVANIVRYRPRSAVRDLGKALGFAETSLDGVAKLHSHYGGVSLDAFRQGGIDPELPMAHQLVELIGQVQDFPRHLSIHPGGFLLGHEPVCELVPIENASMEGRTVIQWDKEDIEDMGLFKVDILGLGALTHLDLCFRMLEAHRGEAWSMATIPPGDAATFDMMCRADTVGVFQIESRAQMAMLPRLRPRTFYDLVIEISIVRPGPISGGMVHPYLRRRAGEEVVVYPHDMLIPVLEKTLGVPLFQEQVMRLAVVAADYTPGEADQLRRDMAAWRRGGRLEKHRRRLIERMEEKGIQREFAERVFEQIQGFGEYGFPESHAASFALISYATSWLKCHYPVEFACGILNAQPMGFYAPSTLIEDAKRHGVVVRSVDVTRSSWDCTLEVLDDDSFALRIGARFVKGLAVKDWTAVAAAREEASFTSLDDLARRARVGLPVLLKLAESGALEGLCSKRRDAIWEVRRLASLRECDLGRDVPESPVAFADLMPGELVGWDYATMLHSTRGHPLEAVRDQLAAQGLQDARGLGNRPHGSRVSYAGVVICRQRPGTAKGVTFFTLEDESGFANLVVWEDVFARFEFVLKTASLLAVKGRLESQKGTLHVIVEEAWVPSLDWRAPSVSSRDFH